jgi:hypothetical protein
MLPGLLPFHGLEPGFEALVVSLDKARAVPRAVTDAESRTESGFIKARLVARHLYGGILCLVHVHRPSLTRQMALVGLGTPGAEPLQSGALTRNRS